MQNESLQNEIAKTTPTRRFRGRISGNVRLGILGSILLAAVAMGTVALSHLVPNAPNRAQGISERLAWYVHQGQLKADMHTLASALAYIAASDSEMRSAAIPTNPPMAGNIAPTPPKSGA